MAIVPRIRSFLYGNVASPKSQVASGQEKPSDFWNIYGKGRDAPHLIILGKIYRRGGPVSEAIRTYANLVFSNGYRIEGEDEGLNQSVEDSLDQIGFDIIAPQAIIDALVYGDCFHELGYGQGSKSDSVVAQFPRNPETFRIDSDKFGFVESYTQIIETGFQQYDEIPLKPANVFHFAVENLGGAPYGISLIDSAYNDILWDAMISEATAQAINSSSGPGTY